MSHPANICREPFLDLWLDILETIVGLIFHHLIAQSNWYYTKEYDRPDVYVLVVVTVAGCVRVDKPVTLTDARQWLEVECEVSNPVETVRTRLSTDVLDDLGAIHGIFKKVVEALREAMILETCGLAGIEEPCEDLRNKRDTRHPSPETADSELAGEVRSGEEDEGKGQESNQPFDRVIGKRPSNKGRGLGNIGLKWGCRGVPSHSIQLFRGVKTHEQLQHHVSRPIVQHIRQQRPLYHARQRHHLERTGAAQMVLPITEIGQMEERVQQHRGPHLETEGNSQLGKWPETWDEMSKIMTGLHKMTGISSTFRRILVKVRENY
ncbi:hypothetical protein B0H13DRAFT_1850834 [Mycena leptocephala]|nr:hypothetical protein B0H13DRAFT_1850834 [Mycena leptocephala]